MNPHRRTDFRCRHLLLALASVAFVASGCGDDAAEDRGESGAKTTVDGGLGDSALGDSALGDSALGDSALGDSALGDSALGDSPADLGPTDLGVDGATPGSDAVAEATPGEDTGAEVAGSDTVGGEDAATTDTGTCKGEGCACSVPEDCEQKQCIDTPSGKKCAALCAVVKCAADTQCDVLEQDGKPVAVCVPKAAGGTTCNPCGESKACGDKAACVGYGAGQGSFCAPACTDTCPDGYTCAETKAIEGTAFKGCVKKPEGTDAAVFGTCSCSKDAVAAGAKTACTATNAVGTCSGERNCTDLGLTACSAPVAATETCDGKDNDCDAIIDETGCDDGNPCTKDVCDPTAAQACTSTAQDGACTDNDPCTEAGTCVGAKCVAGPAVKCDDDNPCTDDACDLAAGCTGTAVADGKVCDVDGDPCTSGDSCKGGKCQTGGLAACDDKNVCTTDSCDPKTGDCDNDNADAGLACNDGNACTGSDACKGGVCAGTAVTCDDGKACTLDTCDAATGACKNEAAENATCEDGDLCTLGDTCKDGKCAAGNAKPCDSDNPCITSQCSPLDGACKSVVKANDDACDDDSACTGGDNCEDGACTGTAISCDDKNPCTDDVCDAKAGCKGTPNTAPCDDANACTDFDQCADAKCVGAPKDVSVACDDQNVCTNDVCDAKLGCTSVANLAGCDDGNACTKGDACKDSKCAPGPDECGCQADEDCDSADDGNACNGTLVCVKASGKGECKTDAATIVTCPTSGDSTCLKNQCAPKTGKCSLEPTNDAKPCDADGNVCTVGDKCVSGVCQPGNKETCDDGNGCTNDACDAKAGCVHVNSTAACEGDKNLCTIEQCGGGVCKVVKAVTCDDSNPCTADACVALSGKCESKPVDSKCTDGNTCTSLDACANGNCVGQAKVCDDKNPCSADACDKASGACLAIAVTGTCDDSSLCTTGDTCVIQPQAGEPAKGVCTGTKVVCDDKLGCTTDSCSVLTGKCTFVNNTAPCNDGKPCTLSDACAGGVCTAGKPLVCDDNNVCTDDKCDPVTGACVTANNVAKCDDGKACTSGDVCKAGACTSGTTVCKCTVATQAADCSDSNACTLDTCVSGACQNKANTGAACEDNNACTSSTTCSSTGACTGVAKVCTDNNPCTTDACNKLTAACSFTNNTSVCSDGKACTTGDTCSAGTCVAKVTVCNDSNGCTSDACDAATGNCVFTNTTLACEDGKLCTTGDKCNTGKCVGAATVCNDNNPCTGDLCDAATGKCVFANNALACDDKSLCTKNDTCVTGKCVGEASVVCNDNSVCTTDACTAATGVCAFTPVVDGAVCDDKSLCTTGEACAKGKCTPKTVNTCDDKNPCTNDTCIALTGKCSHVNNSAVCNDGSLCTSSDTCSAGVCSGIKKLCDDGNICTDNTCTASTGACAFPNNIVPCNDKNACTTGDKCDAGACKPGIAKVCNDSNACTDDKCDAANASCIFTNSTKACDDGNACTGPDACSAGGCKSGPFTCSCAGNPKLCDDKNVCTTDTCNLATFLLGKCVYAPATGAICDDGLACTPSSTCTSTGTCVGKAKTCDDANPCTDDSCEAATGTCKNVANVAICNDGNACTGSDKCANSLCKGVLAVFCNDSKVCTNDACVPSSGACAFTNNSAPCDDKSKCTTGDTCKTGVCQPGLATNCDDKNPCTNDSCDAATGVCGHVNNTVSCNDGNACTVGDVCGGGKCASQTPLTCNDSNGCTDDSCDTLAGCKFTNNVKPCNDLNACTSSDVCGAGKCFGVAKSCSDGNVCTNDLCNTVTGVCSNPTNTLACNDANGCTGGDICSNGNCTFTSTKICNDNNACTTDSCDTVSGNCVFANNNSPCTDNSLCTISDVCAAGKCVPGAAKNCSDNNVCTADSCAATTGACTNAALSTGTCDDGNTCTTGDKCSAGKCVATVTITCIDDNPCTDEICVSGLCTHKVDDTNKCTDANACTLNDQCTAGKCIAGASKNCGDSCACTLDTCDKVTGACKQVFSSAQTCVATTGKTIACVATTYQSQCTGCAVAVPK